MNTPLLLGGVALLILLALGFGVLLGIELAKRAMADGRAVGSPALVTRAESPRIVVNLPPDFKPMTPMPVTEVGGARAVLFYTIYQAAIDEGEFSSALDDAESAVDKVFGPLST